MWMMTEDRLESIAVGAGILGTGGGGNPYRGKLIARRHLREGRRIGIVAPDEVPEAARVISVGGMGAPRDKGPNFYFNLATRYGYGSEAEKIQDAYPAGRQDEAASFVPADLLERIALIGPEGFVADRIAALRESGVTTLNVTPLAATHAERIALIEKIRDLAG